MEKIQVSSEKKLTLLLLCWLFGIISAHRFYTGKYFTGILQLLILGSIGAVFYFDIHPPKPITILIFFSVPVWVVIDLMRIITGNFTDKEGRPIVDWI